MEENKFSATYIVLFCNAKHSPAAFDEDMNILRLSLQQAAASQASQEKRKNDFYAFVGFEHGKKRIVAVHLLVRNVELERHVVRANFFVGDIEYLRFWHERKSALLPLKDENEYDAYLKFVKTVCSKSTEWGKSNGIATS